MAHSAWHIENKCRSFCLGRDKWGGGKCSAASRVTGVKSDGIQKRRNKTTYESSTRSRLSKINKLIFSLGRADGHESTPTKTRMIHPNHPNAELLRNKLSIQCQLPTITQELSLENSIRTYSISSIPPILQHINPNLRAHLALGSHSSIRAIADWLWMRRNKGAEREEKE
jgi:hypothetical protein